VQRSLNYRRLYEALVSTSPHAAPATLAQPGTSAGINRHQDARTLTELPSMSRYTKRPDVMAWLRMRPELFLLDHHQWEEQLREYLGQFNGEMLCLRVRQGNARITHQAECAERTRVKANSNRHCGSFS
jgi:hypothetical protein